MGLRPGPRSQQTSTTLASFRGEEGKERRVEQERGKGEWNKSKGTREMENGYETQGKNPPPPTLEINWRLYTKIPTKRSLLFVHLSSLIQKLQCSYVTSQASPCCHSETGQSVRPWIDRWPFTEAYSELCVSRSGAHNSHLASDDRLTAT